MKLTQTNANVNTGLAYPTRTIFHLLALGLALDVWAHDRACVESARVFRYQNVGIPNANSAHLGVLANTRTQCEWFCVAVEYRL